MSAGRRHSGCATNDSAGRYFLTAKNVFHWEAQDTDRPNLLSVLREAEQRLKLDKRKGGNGRRTLPRTAAMQLD